MKKTERNKFAFDQKPGKTAVLFDGDPILTFIDEHLVFRSFRIEAMKFQPHGPVEFISLTPSSFYGTHLLRCDVVCCHEGSNRVRVTLKPAKVDENLLALVREERDYIVEYLPKQRRFRWTITCRIDFLRNIRGGEKGLYITGMQSLQYGDDNYAAIEFDDPLLSGGLGPQVPMTQDWTGLPEPVLAEDHCTTRWKKRYLSVVLPTAVRGLRKITFNRIVNGNQKFFNRVLPRTMPRMPFLYEKADGRFLQFTPLYDCPASHHICEWGYDMHLYAMLDRPAPGLLFRKGQHVDLSYRFEEIERAEVPAGYLDAAPAEIEPDERVRSDLPIYEEPFCRFTRSTLDGPDQYGWEAGKHCAWNRTGGRTSDTGALEIDNKGKPRKTAWEFRHFGPSCACNPIPPASRFRVSAWVRADALAEVSVSLVLTHYNGPAMYSARVDVTSTGSGRDCKQRDGHWRKLEFISEPAGAYTLSGSFRFIYTGRGTAALTEFQVERL